MMSRWCDYKPTITVADLLDSGACYDGILKAIQGRGAISASTEAVVSNPYAAKAANASGSGYGYGSGSGDGDGDGDGYGDGYGYGSGE